MAQVVREQLALDTWLVLGRIDRALAGLADATSVPEAADLPLQDTLSQVLEGLLALSGLGGESMVRDTGWYFMDLGRRLERAQQLLALLRATLVRARGAEVDELVTESTLVAVQSAITYRRTHASGRRAGPDGAPATDAGAGSSVGGVLELLLTDRTNPRSLAYQLERAEADLGQLPTPTRPIDLLRSVRAAAARLREGDLAHLARTAGDGTREGLSAFLASLAQELTDLAVDVESAHFVHVAPLRQLPLSMPVSG